LRRPPLPTDQPLLVLLLPTKLEDFALRERVEDLLRAPGAIAVEPPPVSWKKLGSLPDATLARVAKRQAKRMKLPGIPRAIAVFEDTQRALGQALVARHEGAELWEIGPPHEPIADVNRPRYERMEALGIESGRLGSERILP
jgi:hypothetical protein